MWGGLCAADVCGARAQDRVAEGGQGTRLSSSQTCGIYLKIEIKKGWFWTSLAVQQLRRYLPMQSMQDP